jgi:hypothetical protein
LSPRAFFPLPTCRQRIPPIPSIQSVHSLPISNRSIQFNSIISALSFFSSLPLIPTAHQQIILFCFLSRPRAWIIPLIFLFLNLILLSLPYFSIDLSRPSARLTTTEFIQKIDTASLSHHNESTRAQPLSSLSHRISSTECSGSNRASTISPLFDNQSAAITEAFSPLATNLNSPFGLISFLCHRTLSALPRFRKWTTQECTANARESR